MTPKPFRCCFFGCFTYLHGVLVLAREGVDGTLLDTLLTLAKALVPRDRWISRDVRDGDNNDNNEDESNSRELERQATYLPTAIANRVYLLVS